MTDKIFETPEFKTEAEEAAWWDSHPEAILQHLEQAARNGMLGRGTLARKGKTPTTTIRLDPSDVELAKRQAGERGIRYQTYLKMIIHQALRRESSKADGAS